MSNTARLRDRWNVRDEKYILASHSVNIFFQSSSAIRKADRKGASWRRAKMQNVKNGETCIVVIVFSFALLLCFAFKRVISPGTSFCNV